MKHLVYIDELIALSGYDPNQPRAPEGEENGGQWVKDAAGDQEKKKDDVLIERGKYSWEVREDGKVVAEYPASLSRKAALQAHQDALAKALQKKASDKIKRAESKAINEKIGREKAILQQAMSSNKDLIDSAHHNRNLNFRSMTEEEFNSKSSVLIHQSAGYGSKKGSAYRLVVIDGKPAYARASDHWGEFHTVDRGVWSAPKLQKGDDYNASDGSWTKAHNWTIDGAGQTQWGNKQRMYGYVFIEDMEKMRATKAPAYLMELMELSGYAACTP